VHSVFSCRREHALTQKITTIVNPVLPLTHTIK